MVPVQKALAIDAPVQKVSKLLTDPGSFAALRMTVCRPVQKVFKLLPDPEHPEYPEYPKRMRVTQLGSFVTCALIALLVSSLALLLEPGPRASAMANNGVAGHVYVLNNDLSGSNSITVFNRQEDGSL
ncbi:MAG: hypothetical protein ACJ8DI_00940, partial [Ktedonobacteraceae bacterium]